MLFSFRMMQPDAKWKTAPLAWAFWSINAGLVLMVVLSLLPIGVLQTQAAIEQGTWWARSAEFMQTPLMDTLRWLRVPGDVLFAVGAVLLAWFVVGLKTGWSLERAEEPRTKPEPETERLGAAAPAHAVLRRR
jgi:nitric oxide reductase subunit B